MKITEKSNFRIVARLRTVRASEFRENLDGWMVADHVDITFMPRRAGDMVGVSIPEQWATKDPERYYLEECKELARSLDALPYVRSTEIVWDEKHLCSFCKLDWEELDQDYIDQNPEDVEPGHRAGVPACCERAVDEWLDENATCLYVHPGNYPDTPDEYCGNDPEDGSDYCTPHRERVQAMEELEARENL